MSAAASRAVPPRERAQGRPRRVRPARLPRSGAPTSRRKPYRPLSARGPVQAAVQVELAAERQLRLAVAGQRGDDDAVRAAGAQAGLVKRRGVLVFGTGADEMHGSRAEISSTVRGLRENSPPVSAKRSSSTRATASSRSVTVSTVSSGPKTSSRSTGEAGSTPAATVGAQNHPRGGTAPPPARAAS